MFSADIKTGTGTEHIVLGKQFVSRQAARARFEQIAKAQFPQQEYPVRVQVVMHDNGTEIERFSVLLGD
jgi:hypothetical protein